MRFKDFDKWANERATDGKWGLQDALICGSILKKLYNTPFYKRRKKWEKEYEKMAIEIVNKYRSDK